MGPTLSSNGHDLGHDRDDARDRDHDAHVYTCDPLQRV
jgi:hypothetical protein